MAESLRTQSDNSHLEGLTSAKFVHLTAAGTYTIKNTNGRLQRVILNTNGAKVTCRNGSEVIGIIAEDAVEGVYPYGVYCNNSIIVDVGGTCDVTIVFS